VTNFAQIPAEVRRRVDAGERMILIVLDAFGLEILERHRDHPLIQRLDVPPLISQFESTTTAHVTSLHFGMPVYKHGLYEWNILEPTLGEIICPLCFNATGAEEDGTLVGRLDPSVLAPGPTFYETLAVSCIVAQRSRLAGSFTAVATRGAHGSARAPKEQVRPRPRFRRWCSSTALTTRVVACRCGRSPAPANAFALTQPSGT